MAHSKLLAEIHRLRDAREIGSFYANAADSWQHLTGFVEFVSQEHFLVRGVSSHGFQNGFSLRELDELYRIETDGSFERKAAALYKLRGQKHTDFLPPLTPTCDLKLELLLAAQRRDLALMLQIGESPLVMGFVRELSDDTLDFALFEDNGAPDGFCLVEIEEIRRINCDTLTLQDLKLLAR